MAGNGPEGGANLKSLRPADTSVSVNAPKIHMNFEICSEFLSTIKITYFLPFTVNYQKKRFLKEAGKPCSKAV